ncbi:MAG: PEP/pyruvate-binding domain-containing protein [Methanobacteriota archaeon]
MTRESTMSDKEDVTKHHTQDDQSTLGTSSNSTMMHELNERVKELNCFYRITKIVRNSKFSIDEALQKIVELILPAWQYPESTCARIYLDKKEFTSENYKKTPWMQESDIIVDEKKIGVLQVYYLEEKPQANEGPFLVEERRLIDAIADLLVKYIEERRIKEELEQQRKRLDYVEKMMKAEENENHIKQKTPEKKQDWEVILDLLAKTDSRTLLRLTRKMAYYLYRMENEKIMNLLITITSPDSDSTSVTQHRFNMPNPKQDLDTFLTVQKQVFDIAKESIPSDVIASLFANWMRQDKARPLLLTSQKTGIPLVEITAELNRFFDQADIETAISPEDRMSIKTALIRRFCTDRLEYLNVAKTVFELEDFAHVIDHMVGPAQGAGKLGGKASGVLLAEKIIKEEMKTDAILTDIAFPKSWYITSDTVLTYIHYNDLDEVSHVKYLDPLEIRQEQPFLEQIFKNSTFPFEIIEGLRKIIRDFKDKPIIVRSSSLLEDSFGYAFSGKYKSLFVPNVGSEEDRLNGLMNAIAEVYASMLSPDPIEYRRERGLLDFNEEMGILIQEVVGTKVGPYYMPTYAGVAFSRNEFRWSPRITREDGMIRMVPGLGTRAVDRMGNDYPILISPKRPNLLVNTLVEERVKYSPRFMDVINVETGMIETVDATEIIKKYFDDFPKITDIISIHEQGRLSNSFSVMLDPQKADIVVTFQNLFEKTTFLEKIKHILNILEQKIDVPVDVEFASDGEKLYILQCRPQSQSRDIERKPVPKDIPEDRKVFFTKKYVTTGQIENIEYIVYVVPEEYTNLSKREQMQKVAKIISELNAKLPRRKFILIGPGRWGSKGDIKLGVPVRYGDINNCSLIVEIAKEQGGYTPELSFGTHFFQDLVESNIRYLPLYPDLEDNLFNEQMLLEADNKLSTLLQGYKSFEDVVRVIKVSDFIPGGNLAVIMDGEANQALAFFKPPDHLTWRTQKVEEIALALDPELYGVKALYLIGSTKDGSAGPSSDIDLLVHFNGTDEQKDKLIAWFDEWGKKLDQENKERTGYETGGLGGLLDVHLITDEDIKNRSSWATHITSPYQSVKKIPLKKEV